MASDTIYIRHRTEEPIPTGAVALTWEARGITQRGKRFNLLDHHGYPLRAVSEEAMRRHLAAVHPDHPILVDAPFPHSRSGRKTRVEGSPEADDS